MTALNTWLLGCAALCVGAVGGLVIGRSETRDLHLALTRQSGELQVLAEHVKKLQTSCARTPQISISGPDADSIAARVSEVLSTTSRVPAATVPEPQAEDSESPANDTALRQGHEIVSAAVAAGYLSQTQTQSLRALKLSMSAPAYAELTRELAKNMNEGKLRYDGQGPPF